MPGLEDLYREIILDHYRAPRSRGELPVPPAYKVEGFNPLCGDEVVLYLDVDDGVVRDVRTSGQGCSISQASTSMMSAAVKGQPIDDARQLIRAFKALMSTHESKLEGDGEADEHQRARHQHERNDCILRNIEHFRSGHDLPYSIAPAIAPIRSAFS